MSSDLKEDDPRPRLAYDRTLLANERTFAAWLRTGLSVAALGLAIAHFIAEPASARWYPRVLGALFVGLGIGTVLFGAWRFARVARDLEATSSPSSALAPWVVYTLAAAASLLLVGVMLLF
jgi:putative membrane protein